MPKDPHALLRALVRAEATRARLPRDTSPSEKPTPAPAPTAPRRTQATPRDENDH
ncbi:hypothetical protein [Streptomyces sp. NPDC046939]|uniref:hypothetical protein n=1 Tax=Streptomyces sp. NPDC046939 TaxID=3155376 RepID=UPI0033E8428D